MKIFLSPTPEKWGGIYHFDVRENKEIFFLTLAHLEKTFQRILHGSSIHSTMSFIVNFNVNLSAEESFKKQP